MDYQSRLDTEFARRHSLETELCEAHAHYTKVNGNLQSQLDHSSLEAANLTMELGSVKLELFNIKRARSMSSSVTEGVSPLKRDRSENTTPVPGEETSTSGMIDSGMISINRSALKQYKLDHSLVKIYRDQWALAVAIKQCPSIPTAKQRAYCLRHCNMSVVGLTHDYKQMVKVEKALETADAHVKQKYEGDDFTDPEVDSD